MIQPNRFLRVVSFVFSRAQPFPFISTNSREQNSVAVLWHLQNFSVLMNISYFCPVDMDWQSKTTRNLNMSIFNARKYMPRFRYSLLMATNSICSAVWCGGFCACLSLQFESIYARALEDGTTGICVLSRSK